MISEKIKFYADTPRGEKNKQFCFKTNLLNISDTIKRFIRKKFVIRAAWYEKIDTCTGELIENTRIPAETLQDIFNEVISEYNKNDHSHYKK